MTRAVIIRPMRLALYPGSFDPVTCGHLDVLRRGLALFDRVVVGVGRNPAKQAMFTPEERCDLVRRALAEAKLEARVEPFSGLAVDFARALGATVLLRGLRGAGDLDAEVAMAQVNRHLAPAVETLFLPPDPAVSFISSRLVRESGTFGAALRGLVPESIRADVERRLRERRNDG